MYTNEFARRNLVFHTHKKRERARELPLLHDNARIQIYHTMHLCVVFLQPREGNVLRVLSAP